MPVTGGGIIPSHSHLVAAVTSSRPRALVLPGFSAGSSGTETPQKPGAHKFTHLLGLPRILQPRTRTLKSRVSPVLIPDQDQEDE